MSMEKEGKSRWKVGKESIIPLVMGIFAYIGLETLIVILNLPTHTYNYITFAIFPAIAIPIVMGAKYGPILGFLTGFGGKILADGILYGGVWIWWPIAFGLMGLIPGLRYHKYYLGKYSEGWNLFRLSLYALLAAFIGISIASFTSVFVDQAGLLFPIIFYFIPGFFIAAMNGVLFAPLMARGLEYFENKYFQIEKSESPSPSTTSTSQISIIVAAISLFLSGGLFFINNLVSSGGHMGTCLISVPFGHLIAGDMQIYITLGMYIFLGIGLAILIILLVRTVFLKIKKR